MPNSSSEASSWCPRDLNPLHGQMLYGSRIGSEECWAVFDGTSVRLVGEFDIETDDATLNEGAAEMDITDRVVHLEIRVVRCRAETANPVQPSQVRDTLIDRTRRFPELILASRHIKRSRSHWPGVDRSSRPPVRLAF